MTLRYIVDINNPTATLQQSLDQLVKGSAEWQLPINIRKCSVITINRSESHTTHTASDYYLDGSPLVESSSVMDLGIEINSDLSFQFHIGSIVAKARQHVGILFRGFHTRQVILLKRLINHIYTSTLRIQFYMESDSGLLHRSIGKRPASLHKVC